jgi:hypothetical protein
MVIVAADQLAQCVEVQDLKVTTSNGNKSLLVKFRKDSTYGFQLDSQKTSDLGACHPQREIRPRTAVRQQPLRQVDYECRHAFPGAPVAEEQHDTIIAANVVAQSMQDVCLKHFALVAEMNKFGAGYDADFAWTQRDRIAAILAAADTIETQEIAGHLKAGYLTEAVFGKYRRLEISGMDRINRIALST